MNTIKATLYGTATCRRYQRMKTAMLEAAEKTQTAITLKEIAELETLEQFNPLSLPRLYLNDKLVASKNPPKVDEVVRFLQARIE